MRPRRSYGDLIEGRVAAAHRRHRRRRWPAGLAVAEHGRALPRIPGARHRGRARRLRRRRRRRRPRSGSSPAASRRRPRPAPSRRRRGRAEGGALRGGSRRSQRQAFRRLGDLADRDRDARARAAARARHPRRRRGAGAQAHHDLAAPPQHRQGPAGDPHGRDHVQAAGRFSGRRHLQRARHPDEAGRADARRAARRARR